MLYSQYRWSTPDIEPEAAAGLSQALSVSPLVARLLVGRGVLTEAEAERFLHPDLSQMHDPYLLHGMDKAVPRIQQALERGEHILIYGDYDADGVSSTSLMIHLMRHLGASYDIYIPHRSNEGYGLHNHALDWAHQQGVTLIITVDTGISAVEQIAYASSLGMEVIVTDHHEPPEVLPEAYALINPKLPQCSYPFKGLAGAGVALKLAQALIGEVPREWMEIASIGTVADLMPLEGENRVIVSYGVESMRDTRLPGVSALLEISGVKQEQVTSVNIAFAMAPRINASGRLDHAGRAVSLLTTDNLDEAHMLAGQLDLLNRERQQVVESIVQEAVAMLEHKIQSQGSVPHVILLAGEGWNVGVVGIVASKLLERYYRPTLILGIDPETGMCKGSARSIDGLDIYEALTACKHTLDHYGGHPAAAGMTLHRDQLVELERGLNDYAAGVLKEEDFIPRRLADDNCLISDVPLKVIQEIDRLQPFGMSNPSPRFVLNKVTIKETRTMGREKRHLKLVLEQEGWQLEAVAFGKGALADFLLPGTVIDAMGELSINEWNGTRKPQFMLHDLAVSEAQVFDLRGSADPLNGMKQFMRTFEVHLRYTSGSIGVIVRQETNVSMGNSLYEPCLWVYDRKVGLLPRNAAAQHYGQEQVRTLFVFDTPETPEQLDAMLKLFSGAENIILLHGSGHNRRDRLQMPSRELFKRMYVLVSKWGAEPVGEQEITPVLSRQCSCSVRMITMMLDVFEELGFIHRRDGNIEFVANPPKRDLATSRNYRAIESMAETEQVMLDAPTSQLTQWMITRMKGVS